MPARNAHWSGNGESRSSTNSVLPRCRAASCSGSAIRLPNPPSPCGSTRRWSCSSCCAGSRTPTSSPRRARRRRAARRRSAGSSRGGGSESRARRTLSGAIHARRLHAEPPNPPTPSGRSAPGAARPWSAALRPYVGRLFVRTPAYFATPARLESRASLPSAPRRAIRTPVPPPLARGLYERLVTTSLDALLRTLGDHVDRAALDPADAHRVLARHLAATLSAVLRDVPGDGRVRLEAQIALANAVVDALRARLGADPWLDGERVADTADELRAVVVRDGVTAPAAPERPGVPLAVSGLLVNGRGEHRIGHEIQRELASADAVDLVCAFVRWYGLRLLEPQLRRLLDAGRRLRVLTTVYTGSTEARALDALAEWGAEVKVSYDVSRTRLHAKAWLFHRDSGYSTAYIGSSNLSASALLDGLEWNVRLSAIETPHVLDHFSGTFEAYWNDPEFEPYGPAQHERFARAVARTAPDPDTPLAGLDIQPYPFQRLILDALAAERTLHDRWRNLVVAATGTGKTVIAALDYRRVRAELAPARLLFVAHRREILRQSRAVFREVLRDQTFGELWVDGERPTEGRHVFASIQTLAKADLAALAPDAFDVVIVDEVHHAEATTYTTLLGHLTPRLLLGLTATPERADGGDVRRFFGGRIAAELRLWAALEQQILAPFQYFGLYDGTDLSAVKWSRGGYEPAALDNVYVLGRESARRRVGIIVEALRRKVPDVAAMRALGFCVSVRHAAFIAAELTAFGIPALAITGDTDRDTRARALQQLRDREVNVLFTVDLFNEGIDVPEVDTLLLLRPTESATVFLQQLGRGLRRAEGKVCCTVLDFIGRPSRQFRFDVRYRALAGGSPREVKRKVDEGFPVLPPGCAIDLDREAAALVLENVRDSIGMSRRRLVEALRDCGSDASLVEFLAWSGLEPGDLYRKLGSRWLGWTALRREAGMVAEAPSEWEAALAIGVARLVHLDDDVRLAAARRLFATLAPSGDRIDTMLHFLLWGGAGAQIDVAEGLRRVAASAPVLDEIRQLLPLVEDRTDHLTWPLELDVPLRTHAAYTLDEILAALDRHRPGQRYARHQAGVLFDSALDADVFFVTTNKSERDYSPTTMYRDYAISPDLFHWESQSTTAAASAAGQRYRHHRTRGSHVLLFVRRDRTDERGLAAPYRCLGLADYVRHEGERPMAITWRLRRPMPAAFYLDARLAAA
ncbi:MAG: DUF3427 domain-containing protein [bacterium]|nr:DUF3427 domain-containing protein [bacterium]